MTTITYHESERAGFRPSPFASLIRPVVLTVVRLRDAWQRRQTEKMLEGLPTEIRKDIGWPTTNAAPSRR